MPAPISPFIPMIGAYNAHVQTLLPRILRKRPLFQPVWQRVKTPDDDFLDLCWSESPEQALGKPLVILFHGLAGSFNSPYANGLMQAFKQRGWLAVLMHFRGCSGEVNRQARSYHSGEIQDPRFILEYLASGFSQVPRVAVGVSLGGNMLVRYLAHFSQNPLIEAACVISPPLDLSACSLRIQQGFSQFYQAYLLRSMRRTLVQKLQQHAQIGHWRQGETVRIRTLLQFDETVTAPLHGFNNAQDYYQQCSGLSVLQHINTPLCVIHAKDDPFMTEAVIPDFTLPSNIQYHLSNHGGHVGFVAGTLTQPQFWLEQAVPDYLSPHLQN